MAVRSLSTDDHEAFRESFSTFIQRELAPHYLDWEEAGIAPRGIFSTAGRYGFVGMAVPEQYGGGGTKDFRFNAVICEELAAAGISGAGLGLTLHNDITTPYFIEYCNEEQAQRWLPGVASGELITAIAMTEFGPRQHHHHGSARRRSVRAQRLEDVHHERHQRGPRHRCLQDGPDRQAHGDVPARRRARDARIRAWPPPGQRLPGRSST